MWLIGKSIRQMHSGLSKSGSKRGAGGIGGVFLMFSKEKKQLKNLPKQIMKDFSRRIANELTKEDVPVRTGHYVASHVVQTTEPAYPRSASPTDPPFAPRLYGSASEPYRMPVRASLKNKAKALIESGANKIFFGNRASYAHIVEKLGWLTLHEHATTGPYFVFGKAAGSVYLQKKQIAQKAKRKVFK